MVARKVPGNLHLTPWFLQEMVILKVPGVVYPWVWVFVYSGIDVDPIPPIQDSGDAGNPVTEFCPGQLSADAETRAVLGLISSSVCFSLSRFAQRERAM